MTCLAQQLDAPGDPFISWLFAGETRIVFLLLFALGAVLVVRKYLRRTRARDLTSPEE